MGTRKDRSLSDDTETALHVRAAQNGPLGIGSRLAAIGEASGGVELDITRDRAEPDPALFE